jgi:predicted ribosome quality control (RQC) complex YloA/Tae2 family protein
MKRQFSSIDIHYMCKELSQLEGSRVDKIYHPEHDVILISLFKSNEGKKLLKIKIGIGLYFCDSKEEGDTLGFGMLLRKHLDGYFLEKIEQINPERIVKLTFANKETTKFLYFEFFGKGNSILCDSSNTIINALDHAEFKDRVIKPKEHYKWPVQKFNFFEINGKELRQVFLDSRKETLVTSLATDLGLGGIYSEEACMVSGVPKDEKPKDLTEKEISKIHEAIKEIISEGLNPIVLIDDGNVKDFAPFVTKNISGKEVMNFGTFSQACDYFYLQFREEKKSPYDAKIEELQRIISSQENSISELHEEEKDFRLKGEAIYQNYTEVKEILDELNKASKKYSWKEIKEKLKCHKTIKELNDKDRKIVVEF